MKKPRPYLLLLAALLTLACQFVSQATGEVTSQPAATIMAIPPDECTPCQPAIGPGEDETASPLLEKSAFLQQIAAYLSSQGKEAEYSPGMGLVVITQREKLPVYITLIEDGGDLYRMRLDREAWYIDTRSGVPGLDWWATVSIINRDKNSLYAVIDPDLENHLWLRGDYPFAVVLSLSAFNSYLSWYTLALDEIFVEYDFLSLQ